MLNCNYNVRAFMWESILIKEIIGNESTVGGVIIHGKINSKEAGDIRCESFVCNGFSKIKGSIS